MYLFAGFISDQKEFEARLHNTTHPPSRLTGPGMAEPVERFQLNNLSFAGPVIMGVGGKNKWSLLRQSSSEKNPSFRKEVEVIRFFVAS